MRQTREVSHEVALRDLRERHHVGVEVARGEQLIQRRRGDAGRAQLIRRTTRNGHLEYRRLDFVAQQGRGSRATARMGPRRHQLIALVKVFT